MKRSKWSKDVDRETKFFLDRINHPEMLSWSASFTKTFYGDLRKSFMKFFDEITISKSLVTFNKQNMTKSILKNLIVKHRWRKNPKDVK